MENPCALCEDGYSIITTPSGKFHSALGFTWPHPLPEPTEPAKAPKFTGFDNIELQETS
jgi:hypothetical protein